MAGFLEDLLERIVHIEQKEDLLLEQCSNSVPIVAEKYCRKSWSQHGEDLIIWDYFMRKGVFKPTYIDIGANHPFMISNTAIFSINGCTGINIDASPFNIENFKKYRPEDKNICCGVGAKEGELPFYMVDNYSGRNSFNKELVESFVKENPQFKISEVMKIPVKKLQKILDECNHGKMPDYMSIDIEGMEYDVLKNHDLVNNGPKIITIEINPGNDTLKKNLLSLMEQAKYKLLLVAGVNYTFVSKEFGEK